MRLRRCPETGRIRRRSDGRLYRCDVTSGLHCSHCAPGTTPKYYMLVYNISQYACDVGCIDLPDIVGDIRLDWLDSGGAHLMTRLTSTRCWYQAYSHFVPRRFRRFESSSGICIGVIQDTVLMHHWGVEISSGYVSVRLAVNQWSVGCESVPGEPLPGEYGWRPVAAYGSAPLSSPHDCWDLPPIELSIGVGVVTLEPG